MKKWFLLLFLAGVAWAGRFPRSQGYVSDFSGVIDPAVKTRMEQSIAALEQRSGEEAAVVTVTSLEGDTVENYSSDLFKEWGIGKKGKDNGVLILLAVQERKVRIEVGYGLEAVLPDGLCGQIIRDRMVPRFRSGDMGGGLSDGLEEVIRLLSGGAPSADKESLPLFGYFFISVFLLFTILFLAAFFRAARRGFKAGGGFGSGGGFGGGGGFSSGGGFGGFGGGSSGGGGASGSW